MSSRDHDPPALRQRVFGALLMHVLFGQGLALLDVLGLRWPDPYPVVVGANILGPLVGFLYARFAPRQKPEVNPLWWTGPVAWSVWASLYYLVAALVHAAPARVLPGWYLSRFECQFPLIPAAVLVYIGVHPLSLLPYFSLPDRRQMLQHLRGQLSIVAVSVVCWAAFPLTLPREPLPPTAGSVGLWVLDSMRHNDPPANCLPSTHCSMAIYSALALCRVDALLGRWAVLTALAISLSTLVTRQHYALDVLCGLALGYGVSRAVHRP